VAADVRRLVPPITSGCGSTLDPAGTTRVALFAAFGVSPTSEIVLGPEHWMFTTRDRAVEVWRGADPFSAKKNSSCGCRRARRSTCVVRGARREVRVRDRAQQGNDLSRVASRRGFDKVGPTRREQLVEYVRANDPTFRCSISRSTLLSRESADCARESKPLCTFRLGTHWNDRGAVPPYARCSSEWQQRRTPQVLRAHARGGLHVRARPTYQDDSWAGRLYLEDVLDRRTTSSSKFSRFPNKRGAAARVKFWTPQERQRFEKRALAADGRSMCDMNIRHARGAPCRAPSCSTIRWGRSCGRCSPSHFSHVAFRWVPDFDTNVIEREKPDVVLQVFVERALAAMSLSTSPLDTQDVCSSASSDASATTCSRAASTTSTARRREAPSIARQGTKDSRSNTAAPRSSSRRSFEAPGHVAGAARRALRATSTRRLCLEFLTDRFSTYSRARAGHFSDRSRPVATA
jgi:hypothetical protein